MGTPLLSATPITHGIKCTDREKLAILMDITCTWNRGQHLISKLLTVALLDNEARATARIITLLVHILRHDRNNNNDHLL